MKTTTITTTTTSTSATTSLTSSINNNACQNFVIGGGGTFIYSYVGVIESIFTNEDILHIENFIGTSAGSIVAVLLSSGATLDYIRNKISEFNIKSIADHSSWKVVDVYHIMKYFGYNKGDVALQWIENTLEELTGDKNITFAEHYAKFKKNLVITGCNISRNTFKYFNRLSNPDMKISNAVRISMSIPLFFRPFEYEGDLYVDGGVTLNYPIAFVLSDMFKVLNNYRVDIIGPNYAGEILDFEKAESKMYNLNFDIRTNDTISKDYILKRTIGVKTFNKRTLNYIKPGPNFGTHVNFNLYSYCTAIMNILSDAVMREYIDEEMWIRTIKIDSSDFDSMNFDITKETIDEMIKLGVTSAEHFKDKINKLCQNNNSKINKLCI